MGGQPDRRYFDSDVRENPELLDMAVDYAWNYPGDWQPMVAARELARMTDSLPLGTARMVLNVMRSDPHVAASLPVPPRLTVVRLSERERTRPRRPDPPRRPVVARKPPPPTFIDVPIRIKAAYGISQHRGYKTHIVASATCVFSKDRGYHGRPSGDPRYPWAHLKVRWACQPWQHTEWPHLFVAPPENADFCRGCDEALEEAIDAANAAAYAALHDEEDGGGGADPAQGDEEPAV